MAPSTPPSPVPAPPRLTPTRRRVPSRRTALTVEAIVEAAIEVLDEAGVGGLSMRRVAEQLGTGAASLYAHVSGKEELLELVYDELVGQVSLPEPDPAHWREQVHQMLGDLFTVLSSHRDAAMAGLGRIPTSPKTLDAAETMVAVLRAGGLSDRTIALGLDQLILHVSACAFEAGLYAHSGMSPQEMANYYIEVHAFYEALPTDRYPILAAIAPEMTGHDSATRFAFGIDIMLSGMVAIDS